MDLFENDPERLADMTLAEYAELGGWKRRGDHVAGYARRDDAANGGCTALTFCRR